jgi:hypothetical protein
MTLSLKHVADRIANTITRHHCQAVYSSQASRHVAEQIDALYWRTGSTEDAWGRGGDDDVLNRGANLTDPAWVKHNHNTT